MGLTVTCARCHDHKYDPVPTDDYYSLYGVIASSTEPGEPPLIGDPQEGEAYQQFMTELAKREQALNEFRDGKYRDLLKDLRGRVKDYLCQVVIDTMKDSLPDDADLSFNADELRPAVVRRWKQYFERTARDGGPVFALWHEFAALPRDKFDEAARALSSDCVPAMIRPGLPIDWCAKNSRSGRRRIRCSTWPNLWRRAGRDREAMASVGANATSRSGRRGAQAARAVARRRGRAVATIDLCSWGASGGSGGRGAARFRSGHAKRIEQTAEKRRRTEDQLTGGTAPGDGAGRVADAAPSACFLRGDPARPDREVPRRFVQFLAAEPGKPFEHGGGRLELAQAIASPNNPLTPRVLVNRVWMHHFGAPLVRTPGDFGLRSEPPTHPQLLDYLSRWFIDEGWSLKRLHRLIVLSNTYAQASEDRAECRAVDPENRLLWRANRRRLDFEGMRDSLLAAAGRLDAALTADRSISGSNHTRRGARSMLLSIVRICRESSGYSISQVPTSVLRSVPRRRCRSRLCLP